MEEKIKQNKRIYFCFLISDRSMWGKSEKNSRDLGNAFVYKLMLILLPSLSFRDLFFNFILFIVFFCSERFHSF